MRLEKNKTYNRVGVGSISIYNRIHNIFDLSW